MKPLDLSPAAPWRQRYLAPSLLYAFMAKNAPQRGLAAYNPGGVYQLFAWDVPTGGLRQLSFRAEGLLGAGLDPDGQYVYYLDDRQGNEIGHFARFPYAGTLSPDTSVDMTPDLPPYSPAGVGRSRNGRLLGQMAGTASGFDLYLIDLHPDGSFDAPRPLFHSDPLVFGPLLSSGGEMAVIASTEKTGRPEFSLIALDTRTGERLRELWDGEHTSLQPNRFSPVAGDLRLIATTNKSGIEQLLIWNLATGERQDLVLEGVPGSLHLLDWSKDGRRLLVQSFNQAAQQLYVYDLTTTTLTALNHPGGTFGSVAFAGNGEIFAMLEDSTRPRRLVALDDQTGELVREVLAASSAPPGQRWRAVTFPSSDGQMVHGWLAVPEGQGPFPTILEMIGGPGGVKVEGFVPGHQAWLDHGFAFLTVNYRGCSSFGREFETKIHGDLGHWEVEDIVAARRFLVESDIADPDQLLLTGWSYGGYLTLMSLSLYPTLWAGGMAGIAIADWAIQYEDTADVLRGFQTVLLGGTPQQVPEQYAKSSPITYAEAVRAPVLIIQGRNDTRAPARPIELYEAKMKRLGKDIEVEWFDTGHAGSFADANLGMQHQERMMCFAYRVLG